MFVRDYMTRNVTTISDDATLLDAVLMIRRTGKRHVPIVSKTTGKVVGIISERDVLRLSPSVLEKHTEESYNRVFESTPVAKAMTKNPVSISPDAPVGEAVQQFYSTRVGALLVLESGELRGILSVTDMLGLLNDLLAERTKSQGA